MQMLMGPVEHIVSLFSVLQINLELERLSSSGRAAQSEKWQNQLLFIYLVSLRHVFADKLLLLKPPHYHLNCLASIQNYTQTQAGEASD